MADGRWTLDGARHHCPQQGSRASPPSILRCQGRVTEARPARCRATELFVIPSRGAEIRAKRLCLGLRLRRQRDGALMPLFWLLAGWVWREMNCVRIEIWGEGGGVAGCSSSTARRPASGSAVGSC